MLIFGWIGVTIHWPLRIIIAMYNFLNQSITWLFPNHLPPGTDFAIIAANANYRLAALYFFYDALLFILASIWGGGFIAALVKKEEPRQPVLNKTTWFLFSAAIGVALITAVLFILVILKYLNTLSVIIIFSICTCLAVISLYTTRHKLTKSLAPGALGSYLPFVILMALLALFQIAATQPWTISDGSKFHIPYANFFLENHGLFSTPAYLTYPLHTLNLNLFYSLALLICNDLTFLQTTHAFFATLSALAIYMFCNSTGLKPFISLTALFLFQALPVVHYSRFGANVDLACVFFILITIFAFYVWSIYKYQWLLIIASICLGMAVGTKYIMCAFIFPAGISLLIISKNRKTDFCMAATWIFIFGSWWYLRNFFISGNPVHPLATNIFGLYNWDASDVFQQFSSVTQERIPRTLVGLVFMPYYAFKDNILRDQGAALIISILFVSTPFLFLVNSKLKILLVFAWSDLIFWFLSAHDVRFLMPIMPLVLIYAGFVLDAIFTALLPQSRMRMHNLLFTGGIGILLSISIQQQLIPIFYSWFGEPKDKIDQAMRINPLYDLISHTNEYIQKTDTVYQIYMGEGRWFFKGIYAGTEFGPNSYNHILTESSDNAGNILPEKLQHTLQDRYHAIGFLLPDFYIQSNQVALDKQFILKYRNSYGAFYIFK